MDTRDFEHDCIGDCPKPARFEVQTNICRLNMDRHYLAATKWFVLRTDNQVWRLMLEFNFKYAAGLRMNSGVPKYRGPAI